MNRRSLSSLGTALAVLALVALAPAAEAQTDTEPPRLPWGAPDLQGVWDFRTITPLQRPEDQADRAFLTDEEAAGLERAAEERFEQLNAPSEVRTEPLPAGGGGSAVGAYNDFWFDRGTNVTEDRRTSLIVDPPDGRLPALVPGQSSKSAPGRRTCRASGPCATAPAASARTAPRTAGSGSAACWDSTAGRR